MPAVEGALHSHDGEKGSTPKYLKGGRRPRTSMGITCSNLGGQSSRIGSPRSDRSTPTHDAISVRKWRNAEME